MQVHNTTSSVRVTRKGEGLICPKKFLYLNIASWNVRTMQSPDDSEHKINLLINTLKEKCIQIIGLAETHRRTI